MDMNAYVVLKIEIMRLYVLSTIGLVMDMNAYVVIKIEIMRLYVLSDNRACHGYECLCLL